MTLIAKPAPKVNYLNNRDILKEIHLSKNTYCCYRDPAIDHQYDIILPSLDKINQRTIVEARRNRADRIKRETGEVIDQKKIPNTDLVFRITCWEHIPMAPKKVTKAAAKKKKLEDILDLDDVSEDPLADLIDEPVLDPTHVRATGVATPTTRKCVDKLYFNLVKLVYNLTNLNRKTPLLTIPLLSLIALHGFLTLKRKIKISEMTSWR